MSVSAPGTPSRRYDTRAIGATEINHFTRTLSERFGLRLPIPSDGESPISRRASLQGDEAKKGDEIVWLITFLSRQKYHALHLALQSFEAEANNLLATYGWVYKPNGEYDAIPCTSTDSHDISGRDRRMQLIECLLRTLREVRRSEDLYSSDIVEPKSSSLRGKSRQTELDSTAIPLNLGVRPIKRSSGEFEAVNVAAEFKKPRIPGSLGLPELIKAVDSITATSSQLDNTQHYAAPPINSASAAIFLGNPLLPSRNTRTGSENTSFTSDVSAVFSEHSVTGTSTQTSSFSTSFESKAALPRHIAKAMGDYEPASSQYGSVDDEDFIEISNDELSQENLDVDTSMADIAVVEQGTQESLRQRLGVVFPKLPQCLKKAPLCLRYEVARVFLHAEVSMDDLQISDYQPLLDYSVLWKFFKSLPQLQGKMPDKCSQKAWTSSRANWTSGQFEGVVMSASLKFNSSKTGPLFKIHLKPLTTDRTHRLGRRFGNDRYLELSLPNLTKFQSRDITEDGLESRRKEIIHWLTGRAHEFLGISWRSFCVKDIKSKKINTIELKTSDDAENKPTHQVFFFAEDGTGFQAGKTPPIRDEDPALRTKFSVKGMLHWLIPFHLEDNKKQSYLKLFSRIALGLSKTYATVVLSQAEIRFKTHDLVSSARKVMNDGCGQMSRKLAHNIAQMLNLDYIPSAFQARIGGAKGMWIVDAKDFSDKIYLEIYPSQVKWDGGAKGVLIYAVDPSHRTFEVLRCSGPVHSATLNLQFLPILENRGKNKGNGMRDALSRTLENGLTYEIGRLRAAMDNPQAFRKWIRDTDPGISDRSKLGQVPYWAGMPKSLGEKINLLLDSGFNPKDLHFLSYLTWRSYSAKCEILKNRLNIPVGRSAYLPMVVDFCGILKPNEVHIGFSTAFKDETTDFCDTILSNMDILVARSPAHYTSDIQKVKAVFKPELSALKDVVVFSTQGDFPLAGKLSGGDYDGDIAWVCWQAEIVNEFENAEMPICPDLVKGGHITKNSTTYAELAIKNSEATDAFLAKSFDFNLKQSLLGICTNFKEKVCYTKRSVDCYEAIFLSTLLSSLVDKSKQGYTFTDKDWGRMKKNVIQVIVEEPKYKQNKLDGNLMNLQLIDHLKFRVAQQTIESTLTELYDSLKSAPYWDEDVVQLAKFARREAKLSDEWADLLKGLDSDIKSIRGLWQKHFSNSRDVESKSAFTPAIDEIYPKWVAIKPVKDTALTRLLTLPHLADSGLSTWELLKASILFAAHSKHYVGNISWWLGGKQLAHLKAISKGPVSVIPAMYAMLKPDNTFVKLMQVDEHDPKFWEARAETEIDEDEDMEYAE